ncbi:MAG: hypothetical protein DI537_10195 [Stutzerimonas stutzeri]|nr:MAG: hypothetical protein DI537_10195 [Stutzerimonas stutzeri]
MSKLGLAYLAVNRSVLAMMVEKDFPVSSVAGPKLFVESGLNPVRTEGFQYATDLPSLISASGPNEAFLRIDLDTVLDLVDTVGAEALEEAGIEVVPGHDRFAYGVDPFEISMADFLVSQDGFEFGPASTLAVSSQVEEVVATAAVAVDEPEVAVTDSYETSFRECDDVVSFDPLPREDEMLAALGAVAEPEKKHTRPWMPRGKYFAWLREQGALRPRATGERAVAVVKAKPANHSKPAKREYTPEQIRAIRRSYAIRPRKTSAA